MPRRKYSPEPNTFIEYYKRLQSGLHPSQFPKPWQAQLAEMLDQSTTVDSSKLVTTYLQPHTEFFTYDWSPSSDTHYSRQHTVRRIDPDDVYRFAMACALPFERRIEILPHILRSVWNEWNAEYRVDDALTIARQWKSDQTVVLRYTGLRLEARKQEILKCYQALKSGFKTTQKVEVVVETLFGDERREVQTSDLQFPTDDDVIGVNIIPETLPLAEIFRRLGLVQPPETELGTYNLLGYHLLLESGEDGLPDDVKSFIYIKYSAATGAFSGATVFRCVNSDANELLNMYLCMVYCTRDLIETWVSSERYSHSLMGGCFRGQRSDALYFYRDVLKVTTYYPLSPEAKAARDAVETQAAAEIDAALRSTAHSLDDLVTGRSTANGWSREDISDWTKMFWLYNIALDKAFPHDPTFLRAISQERQRAVVELRELQTLLQCFIDVDERSMHEAASYNFRNNAGQHSPGALYFFGKFTHHHSLGNLTAPTSYGASERTNDWRYDWYWYFFLSINEPLITLGPNGVECRDLGEGAFETTYRRMGWFKREVESIEFVSNRGSAIFKPQVEGVSKEFIFPSFAPYKSTSTVRDSYGDPVDATEIDKSIRDRLHTFFVVTQSRDQPIIFRVEKCRVSRLNLEKHLGVKSTL